MERGLESSFSAARGRRTMACYDKLSFIAELNTRENHVFMPAGFRIFKRPSECAFRIKCPILIIQKHRGGS